MEIEYKWETPAEGTCEDMLAALREIGRLGDAQSIHMQAQYYDTVDHDVLNMHAGLRLRSENDRTICCLKLPAGGDDSFRARQEFEVEAPDIRAGLELLKDRGAPAYACDALLGKELLPTCATDFMREEHDFEADGFSAKLAFDAGRMSREDREAPISEVEFELAAGSEDAFHACARQLEELFGLVVQPRSKLARASSL